VRFPKDVSVIRVIVQKHHMPFRSSRLACVYNFFKFVIYNNVRAFFAEEANDDTGGVVEVGICGCPG